MSNSLQTNQSRFGRSYRFSINTLKTLAAGVLFTSMVMVNDAEASDGQKGELTLMYHVYAGDQYVGAVTDETSINDWLDSQKDQLKKEHDLSSVTLKDELSMVPEQVFYPNTNDESVLEELQESAEFKTEAKAVELKGEPIAYLSNEQEIEEMLRLIKLTVVSEEELDLFEKQSTSSLPDLKIDETRISEIKIKDFNKPDDVEVEPEKLTSPKEAAVKLLKGERREATYKVAEDDTVESIAEAFNMKEETFFELNKDIQKDEDLKPGSKVTITKQVKGLDVKVKKEKRVKETVQFDEEVVEDDELLKGETRVEQEGQEGERVFTRQINEINGEHVSESELDEEMTKKPQTHIVAEGTKEIPSKGTGSFEWPANGGYISSHQGPRWGSHHKGIDIAQPDDYTIKSADNGKVVSAGMEGDYGNKVVIDHNNGLRTVYAHLDEIHVSPGQVVEKGESIGIMGDTGFSTGIHLHFEVYSNGKLVNPMDYL